MSYPTHRSHNNAISQCMEHTARMPTCPHIILTSVLFNTTRHQTGTSAAAVLCFHINLIESKFPHHTYISLERYHQRRRIQQTAVAHSHPERPTEAAVKAEQSAHTRLTEDCECLPNKHRHKYLYYYVAYELPALGQGSMSKQSCGSKPH